MTETIEKPIAKSIKVTSAKRKELERKCRNKLKWSDGGHWMGTGHRPNCFMRENIRNAISHTYNFPTDEAARKWNLEWEKNIRYAGHIGTAALTAAVTLTTGGFGGIAVGTLAAIAKDELQASITYPRMARGWNHEIIFEHHFKWSPHPWGQRILVQTVTVTSRDFDGKIINNVSSTKKYKLNELPDGLGRLLSSARSRKTSSDYK